MERELWQIATKAGIFVDLRGSLRLFLRNFRHLGIIRLISGVLGRK